MNASRWFKQELRVRYQETDKMGVVYHANYLNWFEIGRTEMIREMGMTYSELEEKGLLLPVVDAEIQFRKPARYDDILEIYTRIVELSNVRIRFECQIRRTGEAGVFPAAELPNGGGEEPEGELLVAGTTRHVWLNRDWRPVRIDKQVPELYGLLGASLIR